MDESKPCTLRGSYRNAADGRSAAPLSGPTVMGEPRK